MNLNPIDFNYIDGENTYPIQDYIDEKINDLTFDGLHTSNVFLNNNLKVNDICFYSSNSNLYLKNKVPFGEIRFSTAINYPENSNFDYGTKIDFGGRLQVYHNYNVFQPTFPAGWYDVSDEILGLKADGISTDIQLTGLEVAAGALQDEIILLQSQTSEAVNTLQKEIERTSNVVNNVIKINRATTAGTQLAKDWNRVWVNLSSFTNPINIVSDYSSILQSMRNNVFSAAPYYITAGASLAGFAILGAIANEQTNQSLISAASNASNPFLDTSTKNELSNLVLYESESNMILFSCNLSNLGKFQGFINSNIITQQYISLLNVDEIKINQTNISNIISSSSNFNYLYSSNSSNLLFNNIGTSSNINYIYSSNNIDKLNILLPNSSFWYDASFGGIWCYDLNIEKYVKASILPNNYKYRSFRITTYQSKADWRNGYNLYGAGIAGDYINFPETLTIHMNNNKQIGGISTADDTYSNGIILGKTKNTNIGYWNILKDNFNYIRYITKVGWDLVCVIEIL